MTDHVPIKLVPPPITFQIETRPSVGTGFSWWAVLTYRGKEYVELLPHDLPSLDDEKRDIAVNEALEKLRQQLAPILRAEDGD